MLKQVTLILGIFATISTAKIVQYQPTTAHWTILDYVFAQNYDLINPVNGMNVAASNVINAVAQHESDVLVQKSWCATASIFYTSDAYNHINNVKTYAIQKGFPGLVGYLDPLINTANEAGRELQKVADALDKELNTYQRTMATGLLEQQNRFGDEVEKSMNTIGDEAKDIDDAKCVNKALRKISRTLEGHHEAYTTLLKDEIKNPSSWFTVVDDMKLLSNEFDTKVTSLARKCIEDGWLEAQDVEEIQECLDDVLEIKGTELFDTKALTENAVKSVTETIDSIIGKTSETTDTESAKLPTILKDMSGCKTQQSTTTEGF